MSVGLTSYSHLFVLFLSIFLKKIFYFDHCQQQAVVMSGVKAPPRPPHQEEGLKGMCNKSKGRGEAHGRGSRPVSQGGTDSLLIDLCLTVNNHLCCISWSYGQTAAGSVGALRPLFSSCLVQVVSGYQTKVYED